MNIEKLSGLELMRSMLEGRILHPPIVDVPMKGVEVDSGYIKFSAKPDKRHTNPLWWSSWWVCGNDAGLYVTGCAIHTMLEADVGYGTLDLNIKMLKAIPLEKELVVEGKVIHLSKKIGVSEGTL